MKDWSAVLRIVLDLGYQPEPLDKERLLLRYVDKEGDKAVFCIHAKHADTALALLAWGAAAPAVEEVRFNRSYDNYEVVTRDPLTVLKEIHTGWKITPERELLVWGDTNENAKYRLIPLSLPHAVKVGQNRAVRGSKRWVKANTKKLWGVLSRQYEPDTYYFQDAADAALARMFIAD
jgi:hypothetical protein